MQRVISRVHQIVTASGDGPSSDASPLSTAASSVMASPTAIFTAPTTTTIQSPTAVSTKQKEISLAVERLQYATLLSERKKAVASLRELAHSYTVSRGEEGADTRAKGTADHVALGLAAIPVVLHALVSDPRDTELMEAMLEQLQELIVASPSTAVALLKPPPAAQASNGSLRSAAAATTSASGTQIFLQLLQDPSPWIRGPTITLVKYLQEAQQSQFAASVLECKEGLRRLLEVVEDKREHIRDAALQVLAKMTEREKNVQQFLAFEDGFVRLFAIMEVEGLRGGSSVVSDCLQIVNNMLRDNLMNQTLFRDLPFLATHPPQLLALPAPSTSDGQGATTVKLTQKKRTMKLALQLVRFLVAPLHEGVDDSKMDELARREKERKDREMSQVQSMITRQRDVMGAIGEIICCGNEELTDLQLQALDLTQLICNGNGGNQIILVNLQTLPSHRSLLSELIKLDIAEDETPVAAAATNLLDALLSKNESAKMAIFQHLHTPPPIDDDDDEEIQGPPPLPAGRVLLDALVTNAEAIVGGKNAPKSTRSSTILTWKACHRFAFLIGDSAYCKELALRIPRQYENPDAQVVTGDLFLTRCLRLLGSSDASPAASTAVFQVKIAILTLLIQWCLECPNAVREVVGSVSNLSVLVDVLSHSKAENDPHANKSRRSDEEDELVQVQGLVALLLGCCLEYLVPPATSKGDPSANDSPSVQATMSRHILVDLISKRVGLERFTSAMIRFLQSPQFITCSRTAAARVAQRARMLLPHRALFSPGEADEEDEEGYLFPLYDRSFTVVCRDHTDKIQARVLSIFTGVGDDDDRAHSTAMGSGGNSGMPSAASAYQDLIRMQDKQIREQQQCIKDLTIQLQARKDTSSGLTETTAASHEQQTLMVLKLEAQMKQLRSVHAKEKVDLERHATALSEQSMAFETRMHGLSKALEQLEAEHSMCGQKNRSSVSAGVDVSPTDAMSRVMADLERETHERRRLEEDLRLETQRRMEAERKNGHGSHASEMAMLEINQQMEELKRSLAEKDDQLVENNDMLEVFRQGQESAKRSVVALKLELESAREEIQKLRLGAMEGNSTVSNDGKHEAAAKEMYQLWEKERVKVRDLKAELERVQKECTTAVCRSQELEQRRSEQAVIPEAHVDAMDKDVHIASMKAECQRLEEWLERSKRERDEEVARLTETVTTQLQDIEQLRGLFGEMEVAAKEAAVYIAAKDKMVDEMSQQLTEVQAQASNQKKQSKTTIAELEDEIARLFFDKTEAHRKAKASLKQAEQELARVFLEKIELEKKISDLQHAQGHTTAENDYDTNADMEQVSSGAVAATALDDMLILLASLEIQCSAFRECLQEASGSHAVTAAEELSRKRGAL